MTTELVKNRTASRKKFGTHLTTWKCLEYFSFDNLIFDMRKIKRKRGWLGGLESYSFTRIFEQL